MLAILNFISEHIVWGIPLLVLLVGTGIYLSIRLGFLQVLRLPRALKLIFTEDEGHGDISSFGALATALAATIGTGNIVGVATAISKGGPGALFWMWIAAFFGMATKYAEGLLAIKYRSFDDNGDVSGGPMYYIVNGMGQKWHFLAVFFSIAGVIAATVGLGSFTQVRSITQSMKESFHFAPEVISIVLAILVAIIIFGGIQSISKVSEKVVPFMAAAYILATITIILVNWENILPSIRQVFAGAFTGTAMIGGFTGATVRAAIRLGIARGVFSNESGLGSAPIAAAAAKTHEPVEQGLISMTGTFIDTIIICTLTGMAILTSGQWHIAGISEDMVTHAAFASVFGQVGSLILGLCLTLFAFTSILGWSYYGERCFEYLFGVKHLSLYRGFLVLMVGLGGYLQLDLIWTIADIANGLMALPNLIAILFLSPVIIKETKVYFAKLKQAPLGPK